jgi:hypothetical protein
MEFLKQKPQMTLNQSIVSRLMGRYYPQFQKDVLDATASCSGSTKAK